MAESGCFLVPTLSAMRDCLRWAEEGALTPTQCKKILDFELDIGACVRMAKAYGVRMASGTDYIRREQHGKNLEEILLMHQAGLTVEEALLTATAGGAELCGVDAELGRIDAGYVFDAIVLDRDPGDLSHFAEPGQVAGVFQAGRPTVRASPSRCNRGVRRVSTATAEPYAELRGVSKRFGGVQALTDIDLAFAPGSIHALVGENGAGQVHAREDPGGRAPARRRRAARRGAHGRLSLGARRADRRDHDHRPGADARPAPLGARERLPRRREPACRRRRSARARAAVSGARQQHRDRAPAATTRAHAPRRRPAEGRDPPRDRARRKADRDGRADVGADPRRGATAVRAGRPASEPSARRSSTSRTSSPRCSTSPTP